MILRMSPHEKNSPSSSPPPGTIHIAEVRYSLPELLREVQFERATTTYAMERLDQSEIAKLFEKRKTRRALKPRQ